MRRVTLLALLVPMVLIESASAAGEWEYFAVSTANGQAGIVLAAPGQRPSQVNGSAVRAWTYLGPPSTPTARVVGYLQSFASQRAQGFFEYPGGLSAMVHDARSRANNGDTGALVWMRSTPGNAQWDSTPTAIAVSAVAFAAAPSAIGAIEASGSGASLTGAAGALAGKAKSVVSSGKGALPGGSSSAPADGTPAAALSTAGMAGLAIVALEFDHHYLNGVTKANLVGGAFPVLYRTVTDVAAGLGVIAVLVLCISAMLTPWANGAIGGLAAGLGRLGAAALMIVGVPAITVLALVLVDGICGVIWGAVPHMSLMFNGLVATIAALAGTSVVAGLTHHASIAHVTGTGAWLVSLVGLIGAGLVALEMLAREVGIVLSVLFFPLAAVGSVIPGLSGWVANLAKVLLAVVFSKVILTLALAAGAAYLSVGLGSAAVMSLVLGLVILVLGALAPFLLYQAFGHVSHGWHGAGLGSVTRPAASMASTVRASTARVRAPQTAEGT